jgi:lipopolysaccharide export LptBFGC system permease protein LptF
MFLPVEDLERVIERNPERPDIRVHLHAQYAFPLRVLVLLLCGLPLVLWPAAGSPYLAVGSSILLSMGFFAVQNVTAELGRRGEFLEPVAAVWLPIALFGIVGAAAYVRMRS